MDRAQTVRFGTASVSLAQFEALIQLWLDGLTAYNSNEEAAADQDTGTVYRAGSGHNAAPEGALLFVL